MIFTSTKLLVFLVVIFAEVVFGRFGCRQCHGWDTITFPKGVTKAEATTYFENKIKDCATGNQYEVVRVTNQNCEKCATANCLLDEQVCPWWRFHIKVWRYCGNGYVVRVLRENACAEGVCSTRDYLSMVCDISVNCGGDCDCKHCGCK